MRTVRGLLDLQHDTDERGTIETIRNNVTFRSANAWTLMFAILIASIGLDLDSTAVIIGAMLISLLMGPIVGAGLAIGIFDFELLKRSMRNLAIAVAISLLASAIYFLLSPLSMGAKSELLARTQPTFFDVLIAVIGGATGIVAASRSERGNALLGVAIATALLPPLCTAGYGLATGQLRYFFGALYLFSINSVFICLSTVVFVRFLRFQRVCFVAAAEAVRIRNIMIAVSVVTFIPSVFMAWMFVREQRVQKSAAEFVSREFALPGLQAARFKVDAGLQKSFLEVDLIGRDLTQEEASEIRSHLSSRAELEKVELKISQSSVEQEILKRVERQLNRTIKPSVESDAAHAELTALRLQVEKGRSLAALGSQLSEELKITFPWVKDFMLLRTESVVELSPDQPGQVVALVECRFVPKKVEWARLRKFLELRTELPIYGYSVFRLNHQEPEGLLSRRYSLFVMPFEKISVEM